MEYIECVIYTTHEGIETVTDMLDGVSVSGFQIEDQTELKDFLLNNDKQWDYVDEELLNLEIAESKVIFYVGLDERQLISTIRDKLLKLKAETNGFGRLELEEAVVDDTKWLNAWKEYYKPFKVGENIVVRPFWEEYAKEREETVITINPGNIFGTGLHESTRMCMETLEKTVKNGSVVADFGTGSGILAVLAMLLGAKEVVATEIEDEAKEIVYENSRLNGIGDISIYIGDVLTDNSIRNRFENEYFDIVCANIVADIVIRISKIAYEILKTGGVFISSGIIKERTKEVTDALRNNGFVITRVITDGEWSSVVCEKG